MTYQIDPEVLARECQEVLDVPLDTGERFSVLIERLSRVYPDIIDNRRRRWIGSKAGGILGKVTFLHMGFMEYLLIFGAPAGTQGFTGRYNHMELYKVILAGRYTTYDLESEQITPTVYLPGDVSCMKKGEARGLEIESGSWHLEYGRGPNITAVPFALMDTVVNSLELKPLVLTTGEYVSFLRRGLRNRRRSNLPD
jgi:sigma non-opioid intracellular receptor